MWDRAEEEEAGGADKGMLEGEGEGPIAPAAAEEGGRRLAPLPAFSLAMRSISRSPVGAGSAGASGAAAGTAGGREVGTGTGAAEAETAPLEAAPKSALRDTRW